MSSARRDTAPLREPIIISTPADWNKISADFAASVGHIKVVGFDMEWVDPHNFSYYESKPYPTKLLPNIDAIRRQNGARGRSCLLQMASHGGMILLVRTCLFETFPEDLQLLLESTDLIKIGVNIDGDAKKLYQDYGIELRSYVDLRNVIAQSYRFFEEYDELGLGLKCLGSFFSKGKDDKLATPKKVRYSNWAAVELTKDQIQYAAADASTAIEGLISFADNFVDNMPKSKYDEQYWPRLSGLLIPHLSKPCAEMLHYISQGLTMQQAMALWKEKSKRKDPFDLDPSYVDLSYESWQSSEKCKAIQEKAGKSRAIYFYDTDPNRDPIPMAAVDKDLLESLAASKQDDTMLMTASEGDHVYEIDILLCKRKP